MALTLRLLIAASLLCFVLLLYFQSQALANIGSHLNQGTVFLREESVHPLTFDRSNIVWHASNVSRLERYHLMGQNGTTIWFTGLSGSGKSTLASSLETLLSKTGRKVYILDGDNLRHGLNRDLGFSSAHRKESVRRVAETARLFADSGMIVLVCFISPFRGDRLFARQIHEASQLPFVEVFVDAPLAVAESRDPKGLYKLAREGKLKQFTGIDSPYEAPTNPDIHIHTSNSTVEESVNSIYDYLLSHGILPAAAGRGSVAPDGGALVGLIVPEVNRSAKIEEARSLPSLKIGTVDLQWVQVLSEGWASPLRGFMREEEYLQSLHFRTLRLPDMSVVNMAIPIVLSCSTEDKERLSSEGAVALVRKNGDPIAILRSPEFYPHRKEERIAKTYGTVDGAHPVIKYIQRSGDWLVGGELEVLSRLHHNDTLDQYRLTPSELRQEFARRGADAVYAFQLRNPIHNGHALLIQETRKTLLEMGYKNPVLWLSPLGGWTKDDDVPLDVRINQHLAVMAAGILPNDSTVLSIFPSPMSYAGPVEVQWHAKARKNGGANFYIVGRDPAGIKHSAEGSDLYDARHGKMVLRNAPGLENLNILPFKVAAYDQKAGKMDFFNESRADDFLFVSGTQLREFARSGREPPPGFMVPAGWKVLADHYNSLSLLDRLRLKDVSVQDALITLAGGN